MIFNTKISLVANLRNTFHGKQIISKSLDSLIGSLSDADSRNNEITTRNMWTKWVRGKVTYR